MFVRLFRGCVLMNGWKRLLELLLGGLLVVLVTADDVVVVVVVATAVVDVAPGRDDANRRPSRI